MTGLAHVQQLACCPAPVLCPVDLGGTITCAVGRHTSGCEAL